MAWSVCSTHDVIAVAVFLVGTIADAATACGVPEVRVGKAEGVADFMRPQADSIAAHPYGAATTETAVAARAAVVPQDGAIVVIRVEADPASELARLCHFQAFAIDVAAVACIPIDIPSFIMLELDRRCNHSSERDTAIGCL